MSNSAMVTARCFARFVSALAATNDTEDRAKIPQLKIGSPLNGTNDVVSLAEKSVPFVQDRLLLV